MFYLEKCSTEKCPRTGSVAEKEGDKMCALCKSKKKEVKKEETEE